jgi:hypothetical protein
MLDLFRSDNTGRAIAIASMYAILGEHPDVMPKDSYQLVSRESTLSLPFPDDDEGHLRIRHLDVGRLGVHEGLDPFVDGAALFM